MPLKGKFHIAPLETRGVAHHTGPGRKHKLWSGSGSPEGGVIGVSDEPLRGGRRNSLGLPSLNNSGVLGL